LTRQITDHQWPQFSGEIDSYPGFSSLRIIRIPCGPAHFLPKEKLWPHLATEWAPGIEAFYQREGQLPDVFSGHYGDGGLAGAVIQERTGRPFSFTAHSLGAQKMDKLNVHPGNIEDFNQRFHFTTRIAAERISMNHASCVITSTRQEKQKQYGHLAYREAVDLTTTGKFAVVPPGVNIRIFSQTSASADDNIAIRIQEAIKNNLPTERENLPLIITASRLDPKKNITGLVMAFGSNRELQEAANLMLAVRAPEKDFSQSVFFNSLENPVIREINTIIVEANLAEKIIAVPINGQEELAAAYRYLAERRSVFVLPALYEPFGLAPLEAMGCGLPAVVTKNGGPSESMIAGEQEYGVLIDPEAPARIAEGIMRLLGSESDWQKFQEAGIERVQEHYTWQQTARGYQRVFEEMVLTGSKDSERMLKIPKYFYAPEPQNSIPTTILGWLKT
jgi:sucrose-phosphate synthase